MDRAAGVIQRHLKTNHRRAADLVFWPLDVLMAITRQTASMSPTPRLTDLVSLEAYNNGAYKSITVSLSINEKSYTTTTVYP
jgi:hypothetical protein